MTPEGWRVVYNAMLVRGGYDVLAVWNPAKQMHELWFDNGEDARALLL